MTTVYQFRGWYQEMLSRGKARRLKLPAYPFAGMVNVLRKSAFRLGSPVYVKRYCSGLPENVFCGVEKHAVTRWILTDNMLWMAQINRETEDVAFAACVDFHRHGPEARERMRDSVLPLYQAPYSKEVSWETRVRALGHASAQWMRSNRTGQCLPGLLVMKKDQAHIASPERMRTALRLQEPQRFQVAAPLMLHGLWSHLRQENMTKLGNTAEAWQMASALIDNPWESWQSVQSGRFCSKRP